MARTKQAARKRNSQQAKQEKKLKAKQDGTPNPSKNIQAGRIGKGKRLNKRRFFPFASPPMKGCIMNTVVGIPLPESKLRRIIPIAKDYLLGNGLVMRKKEDPGCEDQSELLPVTLLPTVVPRQCYEHARDIQETVSLLMNKVANDYDFLKDCLKSTIKNDDFTGRLWSIYEQVREEGVKQPLELAVLRSDYMMDCGIPTAEVISQKTKVPLDKVKIKQIEINTIASGYAAMSTFMRSYHKYVIHQLQHGIPDNKQTPFNPSSQALTEGFCEAWKKYGSQDAVVLYVIQERERNVYDQRGQEYAIHRMCPEVRVIRRTFSELSRTARLDENHRLFVEDQEIAVVYLRGGYTPSDMKTEDDWKVRLLFERSMAIKSPSVKYQLAGTKKVQQELSRPGVLERYITEPDKVARLRESFAGQYSLDMGEEGDKTVAMAMASPEKFVLKPQREGGGNNFFGDDIKKMLEKMGQTEERAAYILMDRIHPLPTQNYLLIPGKTVDSEPMDVVSELGIYSVLIGSSEEIIMNQWAGHLLRTKQVGVDEGGVSAGYATIDSPLLVE